MMMPDESSRHSRHTIQYGNGLIAFELKHSNRRRLRIDVHPDKRVTVDAPVERSLDDVLLRVRRRADWIVRQMDYFERFQPLPTPRRYISGETHVYLGRQYRLKVIRDAREEVKLIRGYLQVYTEDSTDAKKVRALVASWLREHGKVVMLGRLARCHEAVQRFGVPRPPSILFRKMDKRWGSCGRSGTITLNMELAKAPVHCIDYVITHELCHLVHPNHGRSFYALLTICMPDWERRKERLERVVV